jgi:hypothetical protein
MPSRITDQLRAMGCTFYEDFKNRYKSTSNGATFFNDPIVDNGVVLANGYNQNVFYDPPDLNAVSGYSLYFEFIPMFDFYDSVRRYIFDTTNHNDFALEKNTSNVLSLYRYGVSIQPLALVPPLWRPYEKNVFLFCIKSGATTVYFNGELVVSLPTTLTYRFVEKFVLGAANTNVLYAPMEVCSFMFFNRTFDINDYKAFFKGSLLHNASGVRYVADLPMLDTAVDDSGATYTEVHGTTTQKKAYLGSDGLTPSEFPTLLEGGGFGFDGDDLITIPDSDEYTFSDASGDKPFSVCVNFKSGDPSVLGGVISKYAGSQREWILFQSSGKIYFYVYDEINDKAIQCTIDNPLIQGITETWVFTYSGVVASSSLVGYRNGLVEASTNVLQSGYVQMRNTITPVQIGSYDSQDLPAGSEIYTQRTYPFELTEYQAKLWHKKAITKFVGSLGDRSTSFYSVMSLPMNEVLRNDTGKYYTPIVGTTGETEALLGSDGVTTSEFPTLLPNGGFSFDGDDQITIADADEFTFSTPGGGDKPFTIAVSVKFDSSMASGTKTLLGKYATTTNGEWLIYIASGTVYFICRDNNGGTNGYIQRIGFPVTTELTTLICSCDGSGSQTGLNIYRNGLIANGAASTGGAYTQMRNTSLPVEIGVWYDTYYFTGELYDPQIFNYEFNATEALLWHEKTVGEFSGSIIAEISEKKAVAALPMTEVLINDSGAAYTPIVGSATGKQALLGSDGLTASEMPTKLPYGGFSFDGGDWITIPDADEYTFADANGDKPFSVCFLFKSGNSAIQAGILSKYTSLSNGEYRISQSTGKLQVLLIDQNFSGYLAKTSSINFVTGKLDSNIITYDGSGNSNGITLYKDGEIDAGTIAPSGTYNQMRNSSNPPEIGKFGVGYLPAGSEVYTAQIVPFEMSQAQAKAWDRYAKSLRRGR